MTKAATIIKPGENIVITKRKFKGNYQAFLKEGSHHVVVGVEKGYIKVMNRDVKQGWSKVSADRFEWQKISFATLAKNCEIQQTAKSFMAAKAQQKKLKMELSEDDYVKITQADFRTVCIYPVLIEVMTMDWAERTRAKTAELRLNMKPVTRKIRELSTEFWRRTDRIYRADDGTKLNEDLVKNWRKQDPHLQITDFQVEQSCLQYVRHNFPDLRKQHDAMALALVTLCCIKCYEMLFVDVEEYGRKFKLDFTPVPIDIIAEDILNLMLQYFPKGTNLDSPQLDICCKVLYNQIHNTTVDLDVLTGIKTVKE